MYLSNAPGVLVIQDSDGQTWKGYNEVDFSTGGPVRYERARLYTRVMPDGERQVYRCEFGIDMSLLDTLDADDLLKELAHRVASSIEFLRRRAKE